MKKIIYILIFIFIFLINSNVFAVEKCTSNEMTRLKELANNVKFKYTLDENNLYADAEEEMLLDLYNIEIINFNEDLKIYYKLSTETEYKMLKSDQTLIKGIDGGETLNFKIKSYVSNMCTDTLLKTSKLDLPIYNPYYYFNKEKCNNNHDFKYCQEYFDIDYVPFDEIDLLLEEYLKEDKIDNPIKKTKNNIYLYLIGGISLIIVTIVTIIIIKKRKNKNEL